MRKKKLVSIVIMMILSFCIIGNVYAVDSACKLDISASANEIKAGETLTLNLNVSDLNMVDNENLIVGIQGAIKYDDKVFKDVKVTSTKLKECAFQNNVFLANSSDMIEGVKKGETILTITLTVREEVTSGETTVELKGMIVSNVKATAVKELESNVKVKVVGNKLVEEDGNKIENEIKNEVSNNIQNGNNTNTNGEKIPYVGTDDFAVYGIILIVGFGIVCYIKYKRLSGIK